MVMKKIRTEKENEAISMKLYNPKKVVLCPNCHKELSYTPIGNSILIKCPTPNCLSSGLRGL